MKNQALEKNSLILKLYLYFSYISAILVKGGFRANNL